MTTTWAVVSLGLYVQAGLDGHRGEALVMAALFVASGTAAAAVWMALVRCPTLLDDTDKRNLMDREYCKRSLDLHIANFPLLRRVSDGTEISDHARYYADVYGEFYVCSQWGRRHHESNARSLLKFVSELAEQKSGESDVEELVRHEKSFRDYIERSQLARCR